MSVLRTAPMPPRFPGGKWRGAALELRPQERESGEEYENRVSTALMALYRDTRDPDAFDALYAFTGRGVLQWIRSLLGRELAHLDPSEILQDTFVNVYRYPGAFRHDHPGSFRVWVRTIAGNVVRRAGLLRGKSVQHELAEAADLEDKTPGPAQAILDEDESQRLRKAWILFLCCYAEAWKSLGPRDRRTLHLVEVEGLSYQEAGQILAVGRSNMKMIVFRSRRRIARRMLAVMGCAREGVPPTPAPELVA